MNGITINNKQYIFLETSEEVDCDKCDLDSKFRNGCSFICLHFSEVINGDTSNGVFKELKEED
jgi:hypothetical protein